MVRQRAVARVERSATRVTLRSTRATDKPLMQLSKCCGNHRFRSQRSMNWTFIRNF